MHYIYLPHVGFQDAEKYKLSNPRKYHYLNQSNCIELEAMDDSKGYLETRRAMNVVGIESDDQVNVNMICIYLYVMTNSC